VRQQTRKVDLEQLLVSVTAQLLNEEAIDLRRKLYAFQSLEQPIPREERTTVSDFLFFDSFVHFMPSPFRRQHDQKVDELFVTANFREVPSSLTKMIEVALRLIFLK